MKNVFYVIPYDESVKSYGSMKLASEAARKEMWNKREGGLLVVKVCEKLWFPKGGGNENESRKHHR